MNWSNWQLYRHLRCVYFNKKSLTLIVNIKVFNLSWITYVTQTQCEVTIKPFIVLTSMFNEIMDNANSIDVKWYSTIYRTDFNVLKLTMLTNKECAFCILLHLTSRRDWVMIQLSDVEGLIISFNQSNYKCLHLIILTFFNPFHDHLHKEITLKTFLQLTVCYLNADCWHKHLKRILFVRVLCIP